MSAKEVSAKNFEAEVLQEKLPVIVDFWAEWCGPCRMLSPIIEEVANDLSGRIKVCKLNVDDSPEVADRYHVMSIPTVLFFKDGELKDTLIGYVPKKTFAKKVEGFLTAMGVAGD